MNLVNFFRFLVIYVVFGTLGSAYAQNGEFGDVLHLDEYCFQLVDTIPPPDDPVNDVAESRLLRADVVGYGTRSVMISAAIADTSVSTQTPRILNFYMASGAALLDNKKVKGRLTGGRIAHFYSGSPSVSDTYEAFFVFNNTALTPGIPAGVYQDSVSPEEGTLDVMSMIPTDCDERFDFINDDDEEEEEEGGEGEEGGGEEGSEQVK